VIYGAAGELEQKLDGHLLQEPEIRKALDAVLAAAPADTASTGS